MELKPKFRHVKKVILDAGGCIFKVDHYEEFEEALVQKVISEHSTDDPNISKVVRTLFREAKSFANRVPGVSVDKIVTSLYEGVNFYFSITRNIEQIKEQVRLALSTKEESTIPHINEKVSDVIRLKKAYSGDKEPEVYDFTPSFLEGLERSSLDYAILTDAPHSALEIRRVLNHYGVPPERVIPSQEIGVLKAESDLPYIAAMLLLYRGWDVYEKSVLNNLSEIHDSISYLRGMRDLLKIVDVLGLEEHEILRDFASTAGFFDSPEEHWRAYSLGLRSFHVQRQPHINHGFFSIPNLGYAIPKLGQLEKRLEQNPEANNCDIQDGR